MKHKYGGKFQHGQQEFFPVKNKVDTKPAGPDVEATRIPASEF